MINLAELADGVAMLIRRLVDAQGLKQDNLAEPIADLQACFNQVVLVRMVEKVSLDYCFASTIPSCSSSGNSGGSHTTVLVRAIDGRCTLRPRIERRCAYTCVEQLTDEHILGVNGAGACDVILLVAARIHWVLSSQIWT